MISNGQTDLLELIQGASEQSEGLVRMDSVRRLKRRSLKRLDALALSEFARKAEDPAWRTTAAQVLGYHRVAVSYPDLIEPLQAAVTAEMDPEVRRALVYAIRDTEGAACLVDHPLEDVATEAVSGVPVTEESWTILLDSYFAGLGPDAESRALRLLASRNEAAGWVMAYLLTSQFHDTDPTEKAARLLRHVEQGPCLIVLLEAEDGIERTHQEIWPGLARRERKRVLLDLFIDTVRDCGLQTNLAQTIVELVGEASFLRKKGRSLRALLRGLSERDGEQLILVAAHSFDESEGKSKERLAELMLMVGKEIEGTAETVGRILAEWDEAPHSIKLKIRQTRMGIR